MENEYEYKESINMNKEHANPSITFWDSNIEPIIVINKGKFIWKGEEVEDVHNIYERFNEWLINQNK